MLWPWTLKTPQTLVSHDDWVERWGICGMGKKKWWRDWEMERERERWTSITSPLFHYWSKSEGWWRVGQFPQTPSGCPWKWQIVRLIVLGSRPFRGNEPLYLEQKSIKPLHFHSALSSVPIQWGMVPAPHGKHSKAFWMPTVRTVFVVVASQAMLIICIVELWQEHLHSCRATAWTHFICFCTAHWELHFRWWILRMGPNRGLSP